MVDSQPGWIVLGRDRSSIHAATLDDSGHEVARVEVSDLIRFVADAGSAPRWVWNDTAAWYPQLLAAGVRVMRCHDLRLCHAIVRDSALVTDAAAVRAASEWDAEGAAAQERPAPTLFELEDVAASGSPRTLDAALAEFARQRVALESAAEPGRLRLLVAAESAGALIAAELRAAGLPWDARAHDELLVRVLGERRPGDGLPVRIAETAEKVRAALGDPSASLDSQPKLLRALHRAGVQVESTGRWELSEHDHPVIAPLIEYKRLMRLFAANGWSWLDEWVHDGRFRPVYVPAGVVTGRWASSGGGALQIPRQLRAAVRADPGWKLVVADVAQLEPRVLAAMSRDARLADAARGHDLYEGIVAEGAISTRAEAKIALLAAMYGATTGEAGRLVPRLRRAFVRAMNLVDDAARIGEEGGVVSTWLGRSSPPPPDEWRALQGRAGNADASASDESLARRSARDRGRFTRNFVVQGTAAEWALAWLAQLRTRLAAVPSVAVSQGAPDSGPAFTASAHLAFFLHDEVIVHSPASVADEVAEAVRASATAAGRLLFGDFPVDFPLDLRIADAADKT